MIKVTLRMNLSDFLNESYEKEVIKKLEDIHKDSIKYYLILWYEDGSIASEYLKKFLLEYESKLHFKTIIKIDNEIKTNDFIWYDITSRNNANQSERIRFQYIYNRKEDILKGLDEFHKCATFCTSEKPPKRQKRNDYESSNSRK